MCEKNRTYTIVSFYEDDYGCEEPAEDAPVMTILRLRDEDGVMTFRRVEDALLVRLGLVEGDRVRLTEIGLERAE